MLSTIAYDSGANLASALKDALNSDFVLRASFGNPALALVRVHEAGGPTNESFVYLYFLAFAAELDSGASLHREANPMQHEPCGLLCDAKSAANLVRTDAVLTIRNHPNSDEPLVERQRRILKDSPDLGGELPFGVDALALPLPLILEEHHILAATSGAGDFAIRPAQLDHEVEAVIGVREVDDGLLECLWLGAHGVPHKTNSRLPALICQVYYRLCKRCI
jgi:hypothetical protein